MSSASVCGGVAGVCGGVAGVCGDCGGVAGVCGDCGGVVGDCEDCGGYLDLVESAVEAIRRGEFRKVVLSRTAVVRADLSDSGAMHAVLGRLRGSNPDCAVFAFADGEAVFFGATPEELVAIQGTRVHSTALAGTAARGGTPAEDEQLAAGLLVSSKDRARAPLRSRWDRRGSGRVGPSGHGGARAA